MIKNKRISLCLPCRNEGAHLKEVIGRVPDCVDEIIIVSNASQDDTFAIAEKYGGRVKAIEDNRTVSGIGYGFAHMSGIMAAKGNIIICADGDGTYPLEDIDKIVRYLIKENLDFISCNRYPLHNETNISLKLRLGVNLLNWEVRLLYGLAIKDILSGMWVFRSNVRNKLKLTVGDWNLSPQIKINAATTSTIEFGEYPIVQHVRLGETKQDYFKTGFSHFTWILKNRF